MPLKAAPVGVEEGLPCAQAMAEGSGGLVRAVGWQDGTRDAVPAPKASPPHGPVLLTAANLPPGSLAQGNGGLGSQRCRPALSSVPGDTLGWLGTGWDGWAGCSHCSCPCPTPCPPLLPPPLAAGTRGCR